MQSIYLDEETVRSFTEYLGEDAAENIGRMYYNGFIITEDDKPVAGIMWQLRNVLSDTERESRIIFLRIDLDTAEDFLFEKYRNSIAEDDVIKSTFVLPSSASAREKTALERAGFGVELTEDNIIRARLSDVAELAVMKREKPNNEIMPISDLSQGDFAAVIRRFVQKGLHGICEDLMYLPKTYFESDVSCYSHSKGQVDGLLLFHKLPSGSLSVIIMACIGNDHGKLLLHMMRTALSNALEHYSPDTEIMIDRHNHSVQALSEKLFPNISGIPVYCGERQENVG